MEQSTSDLSARFSTPQVKFEISDNKISIMEESGGYGITVRGSGTEFGPYLRDTSSGADPITDATLLFSFANSDPDEPKDFYAVINTVTFRFCPKEALPIQIHKLMSESHRGQAISLQGRMLEAVKPGLSEVLDKF